ncbi:fimbrial protein [Amantichitinum ursilacus]|uniref:S-fimbrial protein subunit SfaA n=1 Tax=Amantichitinum ursilacus TaxID=857265 RepID=A0A0N0XK36_9NEIS|nr:fimbrial protein [Amantichitinum ursilacus]KPC54119.1 S-fimbrial protein subunit SfaA precursor [Amantichitinum ursilacus]
MKSKLASLAILSVLASAGSFAADGTISIKGTISSQSCEVTGNGTADTNFTVTLDPVMASSLSAAAATAGGKAFSISLNACTTTTGNVYTAFEQGPTVDVVTGQLKLDATGDAAENVQLAIKNADRSVVKLGNTGTGQGSKQVALTNGSAKMDYIVEYIATGKAKAGSANSSVMYSVTMP